MTRGSVGVAGGPTGSELIAGDGTNPVGGVPPGLVQRVQRRLAADGRVAADPGGLRTAVTETLGEDGILLPEASLAPVVRAIGDELTGLGPLAPLLADPAVTDVLVNGPTDIWVERGGSIERAAVRFTSAAAVAAMVQRVVAPLGLRVDESRPWVDARLPGGERFHAVLPPLAPDGPVITIRTFARRRLQLRDLIDRGALDATTARLLEAMVAAGIAIAVSGATGTGKTTLLILLKLHQPCGVRCLGAVQGPGKVAIHLPLSGRHRLPPFADLGRPGDGLVEAWQPTRWQLLRDPAAWKASHCKAGGTRPQQQARRSRSAWTR
jgi:hypothetical protein